MVKDIITIVEYNLNWLKLYEQERTSIAGAIDDIVADIQHVGSTAVPGLIAKLIIHIMVN
jgi:GrpB-like predicted nucleotidyltransferase (UPF0157 family)